MELRRPQHIKKYFVLNLNLDVICLSETHGWCDEDPCAVYSEPPKKSDSWSGTALIVNKRISKYIINTGCIGSRIVFCRLRGLTCNIFVIGIYIPQKKRTRPDQMEVYDQLESLLLKVSTRDCIVLMGDFNSRLGRDIKGRVGHWSIHKRTDSGGERLLSIMNNVSLRCVSTYFQPRRKRSNATYMNVQPDKAPSQIDHILISSRLASSVRSCKVKWGVSIIRKEVRPRASPL